MTLQEKLTKLKAKRLAAIGNKAECERLDARIKELYFCINATDTGMMIRADFGNARRREQIANGHLLTSKR